MTQDRVPKPLSSGGGERERLYNAYLNFLQGYLTNIDKIHAPYWEARNDLIKNIISLASASIVLTVTFSGTLVNRDTPGSWKYLLFGSWLSFLLSIISAILFLWLAAKLRSIPTMYFYQQNEIRKAVDAIELTNPESWESPSAALMKAFPNVDRVDKWAKRWLNACLILFIFALVLLGLFGWRQFAA